jgi:hypothetical protein
MLFFFEELSFPRMVAAVAQLVEHLTTDVKVKGSNPDTRGLYYKTLRTRNLWQMAKFCSKLVPSLLSVPNTPAWTNTLAHYEIRKLQIRSVFIVSFFQICHSRFVYVLYYLFG